MKDNRDMVAIGLTAAALFSLNLRDIERLRIIFVDNPRLEYGAYHEEGGEAVRLQLISPDGAVGYSKKANTLFVWVPGLPFHEGITKW